MRRGSVSVGWMLDRLVGLGWIACSRPVGATTHTQQLSRSIGRERPHERGLCESKKNEHPIQDLQASWKSAAISPTSHLTKYKDHYQSIKHVDACIIYVAVPDPDP